MNSEQLNRGGVAEYSRRKGVEYDRANYMSSPGYSNHQNSKVIEMTSDVVKNFWENPKELLLSKIFTHLNGKIKNKETLYSNMLMVGLMGAVAYAGKMGRAFLAIELALSAVDFFIMDPTTAEAFVGERF
jgi:hypothetical protein